VEYWNPLAFVGDDGLPGGDVEGSRLVLDSQYAFEDDRDSSNSGFWPGSCHPCGLRMWATLSADVFELTRPMYSSMSLGLLPAAVIRVAWGMNVGMLCQAS